MRWVGRGSQLWRVRVDLFVSDNGPARVQTATDNLRSLLEGNATETADFGVDQGTGVAGHPVVGLVFWVRADDVGQAAITAAATAQHAIAGRTEVTVSDLAKDLYDVTVIPAHAVVFPDKSSYPEKPD